MVGGVGELVSPLPYEERRFTLLLPPFGVDTAAVYRAWDRLAAQGGCRDGEASTNDLEAAALAVEPRLGRWKEHLEGSPAAGPSGRQRLDLVRRGRRRRIWAWRRQGAGDPRRRGERGLVSVRDHAAAGVSRYGPPSAAYRPARTD